MGMCHRGEESGMMNRECMMMNGMNDHCMMGGGCEMMMHCNRGNMCHENCCGGMMGCCGNMNCSDGMMSCNKDGGKNASCSDGGMNGGTCPMMGSMKDKKDTAKAKK